MNFISLCSGCGMDRKKNSQHSKKYALRLLRKGGRKRRPKDMQKENWEKNINQIPPIQETYLNYKKESPRKPPNLFVGMNRKAL